MKRKWIRLLTPLVVVLSMALALPFMSSAVDLSRKCKLTVSLTNNPELAEDLKEAEVVIDVYQVARAILLESGGAAYDAFRFEGMGAYTGLALTDEPVKESWSDWQAVAQEAACIVLGNLAENEVPDSLGWVATLERDEAGEYAVSDLDAGLYLLIARGEGLTIDEYVTQLPEAQEEESGTERQEGSIATVAYTDEYIYTFLPELVALPNKEAGPGNLAGSADGGEWLYDFAIFMKPGREPRFGSLEIVKSLRTYETVEDADHPEDEEGGTELDAQRATFVFDVEATLRGRTVYSNVMSLTFDRPGEKRILIENKIPVGAEVTVTEVYSGASYTMTAADWTTPNVISATELASVTFTNDYNRSHNSGHGIINHFQPEMDAGGTWIYNWVSAEDTLSLPEAKTEQRSQLEDEDGGDENQAGAGGSGIQNGEASGSPEQTPAE